MMMTNEKGQVAQDGTGVMPGREPELIQLYGTSREPCVIQLYRWMALTVNSTESNVELDGLYHKFVEALRACVLWPRHASVERQLLV